MKTYRLLFEKLRNMDFSKTKVSRSLAIRWKCADCTGGQQKEVINCTIKTCPLWAYRLSAQTKKRYEN